MKFLLFLVTLGLVFNMPSDIFEEEAGMNIQEALEMVGGILDGLNIKGDVEHFKECLTQVPQVIAAIKGLIEEFKAMDWKDLDKIFALFSKLFDTLRALFDTIKPCFKVPTDINILIEKLKKLDPTKLLAKIMAKIWVIFTTITDMLKKFEKKLYRDAGKCIGDIVFMLLLEDAVEVTMDNNDVEDFFKGFFEGIKAKNEWEKIKECIEGAESIILRIVEAIKKIATFDIKKVIEGVGELIKAVTELIQMIEPCIEATGRLKQLIEAIMNADIIKIAWKIVTHIGDVINYIKKIIEAFPKKDFYTIGLGLGQFLDVLFLDRLIM